MSATLHKETIRGMVDPWHPNFRSIQGQYRSATAAMSDGPSFVPRPRTGIVPYKRGVSAGDIVPYHSANVGYDSALSLTRERPYVAKPIASYSKFSPSDWTRHNIQHYASAEATRNLSEKLRSETVNLLRETEEITHHGQKEVGKRLGERIGDISFWSYELDNELDKIIVETNNLLESKRCLEKALSDTEQPLHIVQECLYFREKRQSIDLVLDKVEENLLKEIDNIHLCQDKMRQLLDRVQMQLRSNRAAQHNLEQDYTHKQDAFNIDTTCHILTSKSQGLSHHQGVEDLDNSTTVPNTWAEFSNRNIQQSQLERTASTRLRAEVDALISTCSSDIWLAWNNTNVALSERITEMLDAQRKLQSHLSQVSQEIYELEQHVDFLRRAIQAKIAPVQLAQTRLETRLHRPNVELCRDPPHLRLLREVRELNESMAKLENKLHESEVALQHLVCIRSELEQELKVKANSLFVDREQCQGIRRSFPCRMPQN